MKYIIVHLIRGEAKNWHEAITKDLTHKFGTFPIHDRISPHLTLKRRFDFDVDAILGLYTVLDSFASSQSQSEYILGGFGHFRDDVVYVDVKPSQKMSSTARELITALHEVKGMTFDEYDSIEDDFHATLAMGALKPFDYDKVWQYLHQLEEIKFDMKFDNIAVMKKEGDKWVVDRVWELPTDG